MSTIGIKSDASDFECINNAGQRADRRRGNVASELVGLESAVVDARSGGQARSATNQADGERRQEWIRQCEWSACRQIATAADGGINKIMSLCRAWGFGGAV